MQDMQKLLNLIGKVEYNQFDENGKALGCLLPMYLANPEEQGRFRFDWCPEGMNIRDYMLSLFDKYCEQIPLDKLQVGDFVTMQMPFGLYHFALFLGNGELLHCTQIRGLETIKYSLYEKRIERGYRWNG